MAQARNVRRRGAPTPRKSGGARRKSAASNARAALAANRVIAKKLVAGKVLVNGQIADQVVTSGVKAIHRSLIDANVMFPGASAIVKERKPVRGVKLKTVSSLTFIFALICLGAFAAGRPPVSAAGTSLRVKPPALATNAPAGASLRHDDAGSFLGRRSGQRKPGAQKVQKRAGARPSIRVLFADAK